MREIKKLLSRDSNVIEVGSNVGYYTINLAKKLQKMRGNAKIYAFEANPKLINLVSKSLALNGIHNTSLFNKIVYSSSGKNLKFDYDESNFGMGRVNSQVKYSEFSKSHAFVMSTATLDETLPNEKFDLIRMDAEGSELEILKGAKRILKNSPNIIIFTEWAVDALSNNTNVGKEIDYYLSNGYSFYIVDREGLSRVNDKKKLLCIGLCNLIIT